LTFGSDLSDNSAKNPKKLDLTFGDLWCIMYLQGKEKHKTSSKIKKVKKVLDKPKKL
jgi:hypothetical protein